MRDMPETMRGRKFPTLFAAGAVSVVAVVAVVAVIGDGIVISIARCRRRRRRLTRRVDAVVVFAGPGLFNYPENVVLYCVWMRVCLRAFGQYCLCTDIM